MPHFAHRRIGESDPSPEFPPRESLRDDNSQLAKAVQDPIEREKLSPQLAKVKTADQRRTHFASKDARKSVAFGPKVGSAECRDLLPVFHVNNTIYAHVVPHDIRTSLQPISVMDFSSSVQNLRSKFQEVSPLTLPSIGTVSQSSLYVVNGGNSQVLEIRRETHGERYFGVFLSSRRNRKRLRGPLKPKGGTKNNHPP
jgi:hypothetical protein